MATIDLNSDLGESFGSWQMGEDSSMLAIVSSANVACGFHAGDPGGILRVLKQASSLGVAIGAHVGYPDLVGFGRRAMDMSSAELTADTIYQIGALQGLAKAVGARIGYVKPHGALYNTIAYDARQAADVIVGIRAVDPALTLVALAGTPVVEQAKAAGLKVIAEAFADRAYNADGTLVSRRSPGAVIHDPVVIADRVLKLVLDGNIVAVDGSEVKIEAQSVCVHGDNTEAVAIARAVRDKLVANGVVIRSFVKTRGNHA